MNFFLFLSVISSLSSNKKMINCKDCVFYNPNQNQNPSNKDNGAALCKKYGEKDNFTGKIYFYEAEKCREDVFRCGEYGKCFIPKEKTEEK